jgi:ubiquinone/menaquinone biosynthesis C-methylase UbiE
MPNLAFIPVFVREVFGSRTLPREPEPSLVMDDPQQVAAYAEAGRIDGAMAAAYLFHTARISQVIQGCRTVVDLGCGPATQLGQVAQMNPSVDFVGVDMSADMLEDAREHARELGLANVRFLTGDMTSLESITDQSVDAVISTMALHHLPTIDHLRGCFQEIHRIMRQGASCYLVDFARLKSLKSVLFFAYMNREHQPHLFSLDYERSLRAAFDIEELRSLAGEELPAHVSVQSTFKVPFLTVIKSEDRQLPDDLHRRFREMRRALKPRYRRDLDDIRMFFRLGGLRNDPF